MSWKSIAGNQTISRVNLQNAVDTGVFVQKNSIPGTNTNRQITKADIQNYIYTWDLYPAFLAKSANQLPVKSNMAVQSNQVYAQYYDKILVGNNNRDWVYTILETAGDDWASIASSTDNRCFLAGRSYNEGNDGGGAWLSNDYGETFSRLDSVMTTNDAATSTAMNSYGDYMILTRQVGSFDADRAKIYWSYNSGVNWAVGYEDGVRYNFNGAAMSGVGVYATVLGSDGTNYYVWTSNSYGSSFTKTYLCKGSKSLITGCVGMSKSGQYQLLTPPEPTSPSVGYFYVSNDYGTSWTGITVTSIPFAPNDVFKGCSVSAGGDYMTVVAFSTTLGQIRTYISSDWGANWSVVSGGAIGQSVDSSGQFQYQNGRRSIDYGNTWSGWLSSYGISVNPTTYTMPYIYAVSTGGNLYKSNNQGTSFGLLSISGYFTKIATSGGSNNGKYVAAIKDNDPGGFPNYNLYQSSDYGATWSTVLSSAGQVMVCCAVSDDGVYWLALSYDQSSGFSYVYRSTNSGASWQNVDNFSGQARECAVSNDGKYMTAIINDPGAVYYKSYVINSNNYGASGWSVDAYNFSADRTYVDISMSGHGKYRTLVCSDIGGLAINPYAFVFYSSNYGFSFDEKFNLENYYATSCDMDDSGRVCLASFVSIGNTNSLIYSTKSQWTSYTAFSTTIYPGPLAPPLISGVNVSSDATYWTAVSNNQGYSFTCQSGDGNSFANHNIGILLNKISK